MSELSSKVYFIQFAIKDEFVNKKLLKN